MASNKSIYALLYTLLIVALVSKCQCQERKIHIVYLGELPSRDDGDTMTSFGSAQAQHNSILNNVLKSASLAHESLVHSYGRSFNGFSARLTVEEAAAISRMEGVVSVLPNRVYHLHTTRSWDFMGFNLRSDSKSHQSPSVRNEGDVIIGVIDSGISPEHESFSDEGLSPPPAKWKGTCHAHNFTCNNKIIGARVYYGDLQFQPDDISPRDPIGHGTHTSSTAAGREVANASYFGLAEGVARGAVPSARIAVYKVCWTSECGTSDILKAFDDAIADGVDLISISIGGDALLEYLDDTTAIGAFHAMKHGVLTSASAGNSGPIPATVSNYAPWILTVAASTMDRKFVTQVVLGNGQFISGVSVNNFDLGGKATAYPLVYGGDMANYTTGSSPSLARSCEVPYIDTSKMAGKIVLCYPNFLDSATEGLLLGRAAGMIKVTDDDLDDASTFPFPATTISRDDSVKILNYIKTTENPSATILVSDEFKDIWAPTVASFSSRGPNPISPDILKPDITAPGVDILAAWTPLQPPSAFYDRRKVKYNIISGTSMACPHATGAAAYVKSVHPDWSPAAIKSALMTTSYRVDPSKHDDREFAYGAGHLNPIAAADPGLIFDANETDYANFLCRQGYNSTNLRLVTGDKSTCKTRVSGRGWDMNYPSFALYLLDGQEINATFTRTVTNVGKPSTYHSSVVRNGDLAVDFDVKVEPSTLKFSSVGEKIAFRVRVTGPKISLQRIMSVNVVWTDGVHEVNTPLVVHNYIPGANFRPSPIF